MKHMITLGETMVSFVPQSNDPLKYGPSLRMKIAGAESNTAIGMQQLGIATSFVTKLGKDPFGSYILRMIRAEGVDTSDVVIDPDHSTGIMFKDPSGADTSVFYYRAGSAASHLTPEDLPHERIGQADLLHVTGITPVLSDSCRETVMQAIADASAGGCKVSFDPNIRTKLWKNRDFAPVMREIAAKSQYILLGLEEADRMYHTTDIDRIREAVFASGSVEALAIKNGSDGAWVSDGVEMLKIPPFPCRCVDPVGAGDAFNAGFLARILEGSSLEEAGSVAAIMGAKATETYGDIEGLLTGEEVMNILKHVTLAGR